MKVRRCKKSEIYVVSQPRIGLLWAEVSSFKSTDETSAQIEESQRQGNDH
jgi:hypothetical protein